MLSVIFLLQIENMFRTILVTLIVGAVLQQSVEAGGKDEAKNALHKLIEAIDSALTKAQEELDRAVQDVNDKAADLEDKARTELDKTLEPLRKQLDDLVAKAEAKGFDVSTCQNYVDDFSQTPDNLVHNLIDCISKQVEKAQSYVNDALNNAKQMEQDLDSIDSDIDNCGGNAIKKAKCYAKIIEKIAKSSDAPQHILEDASKAMVLVSELIPNLETCSVDQLQKAGKDAAEDVAKFAVCAAV